MRESPPHSRNEQYSYAALTNTHPAPTATELPQDVRRSLRDAALQRNLRTAAVLTLAVSGGIASSTWIATTAGATFVDIGAWRYKQLREQLIANNNKNSFQGNSYHKTLHTREKESQ